ncbi:MULTISPECIES: GNAT family N-acetyltransferase [Exiguobacterium]|uniref:GNAT family N-acetyltransferase n=1 Tax=Exiguobacterium TaxID=33986 RepID=UPI001BECF961|nr:MULTISPECIES: GNAT family N-acetyltransferase [Exiguobacterium]MCT4783052.1 GNAT family N-acetyltransferase [Exiguobacterium himgiriensis]
MEIQHKDNLFYVGDVTRPKAELHYVPTGPDKLIVDHTRVGDELRGQGIGEQLVSAVVEYARKEGKTIIPLCPFTKNQFERHESYYDVWAK